MYEVNVSHVAVPPLYPFPTGYGFVSANPEAWEMDVAVLKVCKKRQQISTFKQF